jgi:hypothetical protein
MKALSIRQPLASAIMRGIKPIENRGWSTDYRGPLLIHAALRLAEVPPARRPPLEPLGPWAALPRGAILGVVELVDVVPMSAALGAHPFATGPWCWLLKHPRPLGAPARCAGRQGLFEPPAAVERAVVAQLR